MTEDYGIQFQMLYLGKLFARHEGDQFADTVCLEDIDFLFFKNSTLKIGGYNVAPSITMHAIWLRYSAAYVMQYINQIAGSEAVRRTSLFYDD